LNAVLENPKKIQIILGGGYYVPHILRDMP
jgi:hypothetical protein